MAIGRLSENLAKTIAADGDGGEKSFVRIEAGPGVVVVSGEHVHLRGRRECENKREGEDREASHVHKTSGRLFVLILLDESFIGQDRREGKNWMEAWRPAGSYSRPRSVRPSSSRPR